MDPYGSPRAECDLDPQSRPGPYGALREEAYLVGAVTLACSALLLPVILLGLLCG